MPGDKNRWVEALEEAGLIDEQDAGWEIPEDPKKEKKVKVQGKGPAGSAKTKTPTQKARQTGPLRPRPPQLSPSPQRSEDLDSPNDRPTVPGCPADPVERRPTWEPVPHKATATLDYREVHPERTGPSSAAVSSDSKRGMEPMPEAFVPSVGGFSEAVPVEGLSGDGERMKECFEIGDYTGALDVAERILGRSPDDRAAAKMKESCRDTLMQMYRARIGSFERKPRIMVEMKDMVWRNLDHRAGFVLSRIDGTVTFDEIIDMSGLDRFETCRILVNLLQEKLIE